METKPADAEPSDGEIPGPLLEMVKSLVRAAPQGDQQPSGTTPAAIDPAGIATTGDLSYFVTRYLTSERGAELSRQLANFVQGLRDDRSKKSTHQFLGGIARYALATVALLGAIWLQYEGKLDATIGSLVGIFIGYVVAKQDKEK